MAVDNKFLDSIPQAYQEYMAPLIFDPYAADMAERALAHSPTAILEIAAGTGVLTRKIALNLKPNARFTVTDLNLPMLRIAQKNIQDDRITWQLCDALSLPFEDHKFDAVVCEFGAMFFPDHVKAYKETNRVLRQNGRFYFSVWDKISENDFAYAVELALEKYFPNNPPKFMSRTPHGYFDQEMIHNELDTSGFSEIEFETLTFTSKAPAAKFVAAAFCTGTPLRSEIESRIPGGLEKATAYVTDVLVELYGSGPLESKMRAFVISAKKLDH